MSATSSTRYRLPDGRTFDVNRRYYLASCDRCGWIGSSEECGADSGPWGDSDVYCPKCHSAGADMGEVAESASEICRRCGRTAREVSVCMEC